MEELIWIVVVIIVGGIVLYFFVRIVLGIDLLALGEEPVDYRESDESVMGSARRRMIGDRYAERDSGRGRRQPAPKRRARSNGPPRRPHGASKTTVQIGDGVYSGWIEESTGRTILNNGEGYVQGGQFYTWDD